MQLVLYDGTWIGFFSAIFEIYEYKIADPLISGREVEIGSIFSNSHKVHTDETKSRRVINKLRQKLSPVGFSQLYKTFLSEEKEIENVMFRFIRYALSSKNSIENNYADPDVLMLQQVSRKVHREKHRMEAFVRFQLTKDQLYYAVIQPDYNVLPLIMKHFKDRYADQRWLIYDVIRKYGIYYDLHKVSEVSIDFNFDCNDESSFAGIYNEEENLYQVLWKQYFKSVNIEARKNTRLHIQHMPKRYWKYLVEKK